MIELTQGKFAVVDEADYEMVMAEGPWYARQNKRNWYASRNIHGGNRTSTMHQLITGYALTDHINQNGLDNRRINLRSSTVALNCRNQRVQVNSTSGYTGVSFDKSRGLWQSYVTRNRKMIALGRYATPEEAYLAREVYIERTNWLSEEVEPGSGL